MSQDIEAFIPKEVTVQVNGEPVTVRPLTMGRIPAFVKAAEPIKDVLGGGDINLADFLMDEPKNKALINAIRLATGMSEQKLESLTPDTIIELATAILEVNADFFVRRLAPLWRTSLIRVVNAFVVPDTPISSSSSSGQDSTTGAT